MINVTKLYCGLDTTGDPLRYGHTRGPAHGMPHPTESQPHEVPASARERRPVVVWTMSRRCNLHCVHCYSDSADQPYQGELTVPEAKAMLADLAQFRIPALLLSGGEPLYHPHFFELAEAARSLDLRLTLSTNGTLIDEGAAQRIRETGFSYVGISFDGLGKVNDQFRGQRGAFEKALGGLRHLKAVGQKVGLRFTLTRRNFEALPEIFAFVEQEGIDRVCFYHLVYSGRGSRIAADDLTHAETRQALDRIFHWTASAHRSGRRVDVLTVDNHVDGIYLYLTLLRERASFARRTWECLEWNGGGANSSGVGIANIDACGDVHPDQFWQTHAVGNIRVRPFSEIWTDPRDPLLDGLRNRLPLLTGRCGECRWQEVCGGSFRVRALQASGDPWAPDPACYLTDEEIA
ncbi:MAG: radical SAM protein [Candidatus Omnitrophica bacterium]|nr:radical SAM protein [Candidatus Omnitrophota bacterium]